MSRGELGFRWEPGKGSSGCHIWVRVVEAAVQLWVWVGYHRVGAWGSWGEDMAWLGAGSSFMGASLSEE